MTLTPMTGAYLVQTLQKVRPSSASLDGWRPDSLVALSRWFPDLFEGLAEILGWIEENGPWPARPFDESIHVPHPQGKHGPGTVTFGFQTNFCVKLNLQIMGESSFSRRTPVARTLGSQ